MVQQFLNITLPYMIFVMTPYIITSFTGNINNFGVIYLLSGGNPTVTGTPLVRLTCWSPGCTV